ncbi:DUF4123 domain-containing protein [Noviherbaspirillum cavernae]|uniref:DUF4123 domain-containing protein n=1 Tax=Noviherbaspirillum cavernae TaxID=2320862 RepID=A0A418X576_9BURK|nr:DUF4123 domain-containing protein [Noviherbaspirillum cavernae]RJG07634.1 DUF4123 domain-containing protein [Noviherbaspirillum cavernae]
MAINRYPSDWYGTLTMRLAEIERQFPDAHIHALIEGVLADSCHSFLKRSTRLPFVALYANTASADEETLSISPLLVEYRANEHDTWNTLLKKTSGVPALSLIVTSESITQLATRLTPWCIVDAGGHHLALSFADTRILPVLFAAVTPQQKAQLCGPANCWQYVSRTAEWETLSLPETGLPPADEIILSEGQCTQLIDAAEADGVLYQLRAHSANLVDCHTPARAHEIVSRWLACADHARIEAASERMRLCELGFTHPELERNPRVAEWLAMPSVAMTVETMRMKWMQTS